MPITESISICISIMPIISWLLHIVSIGIYSFRICSFFLFFFCCCCIYTVIHSIRIDAMCVNSTEIFHLAHGICTVKPTLLLHRTNGMKIGMPLNEYLLLALFYLLASHLAAFSSSFFFALILLYHSFFLSFQSFGQNAIDNIAKQSVFINIALC